MSALYFSSKYGMVFGKKDLELNFDNMKKSQSTLGSIYEKPKELDAKTCLAGK